MSRCDVGVIDFRLNNLGSIVRGLELAGADRVRVVTEPSEVGDATHLVLPGVGHFAVAMEHLQEQAWPAFLRADLGARPLLGICLGMHLLLESSEEGPGTAGLGLVPGSVARLPRAPDHRVPHVGWNTVVPADSASPLFAGLDHDLDYYFVHSYAVGGWEPDTVLARTPFGDGDFVSAVISGSIAGVQFHPEKSSRGGLRLLTNFLGSESC